MDGFVSIVRLHSLRFGLNLHCLGFSASFGARLFVQKENCYRTILPHMSSVGTVGIVLCEAPGCVNPTPIRRAGVKTSHPGEARGK